jgi:phosphohistidine phosphatase
MELLIVRHADAGDSEEWAKTGRPDSERPLSEKGRKQFKRAAKALVELVPDVGLVASSSYARAIQTTDILLEQLPAAVHREVTDSLVPEADPDEVVRWINAQGEREVVAVVGHEPHLSTLATWLISGVAGSILEMKKGGACLVSFDERVDKGRGTLAWLLGPKQLRVD